LVIRPYHALVEPELQRLLAAAMADIGRPSVSTRGWRAAGGTGPTGRCAELSEDEVIAVWRRFLNSVTHKTWAAEVIGATHEHLKFASRALSEAMLGLGLSEPDPSVSNPIATVVNRHGEVALLEMLSSFVRNGPEKLAEAAAYASYGAVIFSNEARGDRGWDGPSLRAWRDYASAIVAARSNPKSGPDLRSACDYALRLVGHFARGTESPTEGTSGPGAPKMGS
jgi:hypothetical protein